MKSGDILAGKYRLVQRIGEGAMGEVWAGENESTGKKVALKLIIPSAPEHRTPELRHRLLREAKACGKLAHRNIVQIFDVGETPEGDPFLVLELLRGKTLGELLKDTRRIEPPLAARIAMEIASALAVAHATRIIHRDLKPANIFLHREDGMADDQFIVKVLDFGVSKNLDGGTDGPATATNAAVGSPAYMSPEQVAIRKDLDGRTDIWSLGVVLYEMLTGVRPFVGNVDEVIRQIVLTKVNKVPPPSQKVRAIPPELDEIVARCMNPDRDQRFANASELAIALRSLSETSRSLRMPIAVPTTGPVSVAPTSSPQRASMRSTPDAAPPSVARTPIAPTPPATDTADGAATLPMQGRMLAEMRPSRAGTTPAPVTLPSPSQGATGTQLLSPNQPVASPAPAWKQELEQWRAQRQSSAAIETPVQDDAMHGGTQALDSAMVMRAAGNAALGAERATTTSAIGALAKPTGSYPVAPAAQGAMSVRSRRKRSSRVFFAIMGVGIVSALGVVIVLLVNMSDDGQKQAAAATATSATSSAEAKAPTPATPTTAAPTMASASTSSTAVSEPTPSALPTAAAKSPANAGGYTLCKQGGQLVKCKRSQYNPTAP